MADRPIQEVITRVVYEVETGELKKSATLVGDISQQARTHSKLVKEIYTDQMRLVNEFAKLEVNMSKQQIANSRRQADGIKKLNQELEEAKKKLSEMSKGSQAYKDQENKIANLSKELVSLNLAFAATHRIMTENNKTVGDSIATFTQASEAYGHLEATLSAAAQVRHGAVLNPDEIRASVSEMMLYKAQIEDNQRKILEASDAMEEFGAIIAAGKKSRVELLQILGDQTDELNKQVKVLENLEKQQKESGKSNKKLSQEIEAQKALVESYQDQVDETVDSLNNYDDEVEELLKNLDETNEAQVLVSDGFDGLRDDMDRASRSIKGFIKAGLVGALLAIGNEIRKLPSVGNFLEGASNGLSEFVASVANGNGIFGGGAEALQRTLDATKALREQRVAMSEAETDAAAAQKERIEFQAKLDDPLSNISQRVAATKGLYDLEIELLTKKIKKQEEYNDLFEAQTKERRENGNEALKQEVEANKQKLIGLQVQKRELEIQRPEAVKDIEGRNDIDKNINKVRDLNTELRQYYATVSNLGVLFQKGEFDQENLIDNIVSFPKSSLEELREYIQQIDEANAAIAFANATTALEQQAILVNEYARQIKVAIDAGEDIGDLQESLVAAQRKIEDLNNTFAEATAYGIIEGYVAQIQTANTELKRFLGDGKYEEALAKANEIRALQNNLKVSQEASNPDLDLDKTLQDNISAQISTIQNPEDREKEIELIENKYRQKKFQRELDSIKDQESLKAKTIKTQLEQLKQEEAVIEEEYRNQRLERELGYVMEIASLGQQLGDMILEAEQARLDKMIELQEERVSEAERIADEGNAKQLQLEEERLDKLLEEREKAQKKQEILNKASAVAEIAVNTALTLSNLSVLAAKAGATSIFAAPVLVPTLLAIMGGIIGTVGALYTPPSFWEGTEYTVGEAIGMRNYSGPRDPLLVRVDPNERILNPEISKQLEGIPSSKIPELLRQTSVVKPMEVPMNVDTSRFIIANAKAQKEKDDKQEAFNREFSKKLDEMSDQFEDAVRSINIKMILDKKGFMSIVKSELRKEKRKRDRLAS